MRNKLQLTMAMALIAPLAVAAAAERSALAVDCNTLPSPLYIAGSSAVQPFMNVLGPALSASGTPTSLIYASQGSCVGVDEALNGTLLTGTAQYWDATGVAGTCTIMPLTGVPVTVGVSDVFATSCAGFTSVPAGIGDFFGPNQVMEFVVPKTQTQSDSISAEAAYLLFGFGAAAQVAPWTDEANMFIRKPTSGTETMIGAAIKVPTAGWFGVQEATNAAVLSAFPTATKPASAIGILVAGDADINRAKLKTLAFQDYKKTCAFWPDSAPSSLDKRSVRNGDYAIWGPLHFLTKTTGTAPMDPIAKQFIGYFTGDVATPAGVDLIALEAEASTVPSCAMSVKRSIEVGPVTPYTPPVPCNCYFEKIANATTTCDSCTMDTDCKKPSAKHCRYGYCEAN